jgi:mannan endo-1,4-beta-mannosidase
MKGLILALGAVCLFASCTSDINTSQDETIEGVTETSTYTKGGDAKTSSTVTQLYSFEGSAAGWSISSPGSGPWSVTEWSSQGSKSLKANVNLSNPKSYVLNIVNNENFSDYSSLSVTVKHASWGNHGSGTFAKLYAKTGSSWNWHDSGPVLITSGSGTTITLDLSGVSNTGSIKEIGVQFLIAGNASGSSAVYIDDVVLENNAPPAVTPVTPNYNNDTYSILNILANLPSKSNNRVVSGQFLGYSGFAFNAGLIQTVHDWTDQYPGIVGMDIANGGDASRDYLEVFNYSNNGSLVNHWNSGGLIAISHHFPNPLRQNGKAGLDPTGRETSSNISNMLYGPNSNNPDKQRWFDGLWKVYEALLDLQQQGITVIYRPLHEMNGDWFWYGGLGTSARPNSSVQDYKNMWDSIFNYMTTSKGPGYPALNNLIWVYSPDYGRSKVTDYYVANQVDIVSLDAYLDNPHSNSTLLNRYNQMLGLGKPFAFAEIGPRNDRTDGQFDFNNWINAMKNRFGQTTFFMAWDAQWAPTNNQGSWGLYNSYNWSLNRGEESLR